MHRRCTLQSVWLGICTRLTRSTHDAVGTAEVEHSRISTCALDQLFLLNSRRKSYKTCDVRGIVCKTASTHAQHIKTRRAQHSKTQRHTPTQHRRFLVNPNKKKKSTQDQTFGDLHDRDRAKIVVGDVAAAAALLILSHALQWHRQYCRAIHAHPTHTQIPSHT